MTAQTVGVPAPMPTTVWPMLATRGELPRADEGWSYEFKWDGVRAIVYISGGNTRIASRHDNDLTATLSGLGNVADHVKGTRKAEVVIDAELVSLDAAGRPSFQQLQQRSGPVTLVAFDLIYHAGRLLTDEPYESRRLLLEDLVRGDGTVVTVSPRFAGPGADLLEVSKARGLEGVVAKRNDSPYRQAKRSTEWVKVKNVEMQEVVIGGWTPGQGGRQHQIGSLLLGVPDLDPGTASPGSLVYIGQVGTGFTEKILAELRARLTPLERETSPFSSGEIPTRYRRVARFVEPRIVGEVTFSEWTGAGRLRHPVWRGVREDKSPNEVVRES